MPGTDIPAALIPGTWYQVSYLKVDVEGLTIMGLLSLSDD